MIDKPHILSELREVGVSVIPGLSSEQAAEVRDYLKSCTFYTGCHVRKGCQWSGRFEEATTATVGCWHHHDVIQAPYLLEFALKLTDVAAEFVGRNPPVLYSLNAFLTRPAGPVRPDIQDWHPDRDDSRFLPLFIYLTDVGDDGAQEIQGPQGLARVTGKSGTAFLSDTSMMHRGLKPQSGERLIFWARWGISDRPPANQWDGLEPIDKTALGSRYPADERLRESIKLMVA